MISNGSVLEVLIKMFPIMRCKLQEGLKVSNGSKWEKSNKEGLCIRKRLMVEVKYRAMNVALICISPCIRARSLSSPDFMKATGGGGGEFDFDDEDDDDEADAAAAAREDLENELVLRVSERRMALGRCIVGFGFLCPYFWWKESIIKITTSSTGVFGLSFRGRGLPPRRRRAEDNGAAALQRELRFPGHSRPPKQLMGTSLSPKLA